MVYYVNLGVDHQLWTARNGLPEGYCHKARSGPPGVVHRKWTARKMLSEVAHRNGTLDTRWFVSETP